jgi:hypothetical protein
MFHSRKLNTSPPWNCCAFLQSSCSLLIVHVARQKIKCEPTLEPLCIFVKQLFFANRPSTFDGKTLNTSPPRVRQPHQVWSWAKRQTLNPEPCFLNPKPQILNPKPETLKLELNQQPKILNARALKGNLLQDEPATKVHLRRYSHLRENSPELDHP